MKRLMISAAVVTLLAGCASAPEQQEGAAVEEGKPAVIERPAIKPAEPGATVKPFAEKPVAVNPLKDPNNILSKRSIFFDYDSDQVKDEFKPVVAAHARYLQQNRSAKMRIEGNADERGSREYNLALGQRRADAVRKMMQLLGVQGSQVESVSFGEEKPRCNEANESCWSQNRRDDIVYQGE